MNVLGLIPARGGSKSIPHKNITPLADKPLLAYTCEAALSSCLISRVVLSTDDDAIAEVGRTFGVEVPFMRPLELARDDTPSIAVAQHALQWCQQAGWLADILVLLQPTSPLRLAVHVDEALQHMLDRRADTVVSVIEVPHRFSPYAVMRQEDGWLVDFWQSDLPFNRYRRQDVPILYARNGPAVLASRCEIILNHGTFYGQRIVPYVMQVADSIDIDNSLDLELAAWFLARRSKN
ncbi:MAG: cytidylyltransferase domain-containing protein [Chloroflexota bacterium]